MCYAAFVRLGVSRVNGFAVPLTGFLLNVSKPDALRGSMRAAAATQGTRITCRFSAEPSYTAHLLPCLLHRGRADLGRC